MHDPSRLESVAVFARNHREYLDEAASRDPSVTTVFRAKAAWTTAERAVSKAGSIPIYLAAVGGAGKVEYAAELCGVLLDPVKGAPETDKWLSRVLPSTASEGLWEEDDRPVITLYAIRACRKLKKPFPMTKLVKLSDRKPISANYGYSYSVVRAIARTD
jgi:hypothetical protein